MPFGDFVIAVAGLVFGLLILYWLYGVIRRAFTEVGFTPQEATALLAGTFIGAFFDIPLGTYNGWDLRVNVGGAIVPILVSAWLLKRMPSMLDQVLAGLALVTITAYFCVFIGPDGITSPFPLWGVPVLVAAGVGLVAYWRNEDHAAPLAYIVGSMGALIGGDLLHLSDFLSQTPPADPTMRVASIGGAAVLDMVFLSGILAVTLDAFLFRQRTKEAEKHVIPFKQGVVFTSSTPPEEIANYIPELTVPRASPKQQRPPSGPPKTRPPLVPPRVG
ncbi:MAG: DUF1614 domain-containing protein [Thermoplasmatota archaeon]